MPYAEMQANHIDKSELDNFKLEAKLKDSLLRAGVAKLT